MKIFRPRNIILSTIVILIIWGVAQTIQGMNMSPKVTVSKLEQANLLVEVSASGKIRPQNTAAIRFGSSGRISSLNIVEGDIVQKGQALGYITSTDIKEQENKAWAEYRYQLEALREFERVNENKPKDERYRITKSQLEAQRDAAAAAVAQVRSNYNNRVLIAPINGTVVNVYKKQGEIVAGEVVADIQDQDTVEFVAEVDEQDIGDIRVSQSVSLNLDAYPRFNIPGSITKIENTAQTGTSGNTYFPVKITPQLDPNFPLRIGMNGDAIITVAQKSNVLSLPLEYLNVDENEQAYVLIYEDNKVARRNIVTGLQNDSHIEVLEGLTKDDQIITSDPTNLQVGQTVTLKGAK
ncbi:MAG: membrane protein [Patescibacteria group bacterium]|nr:MAG: membrane protein [Patescibacteria group bacterium]